MKLSNDICRCHDSTCPDSKKCARYVQRATSTGGSKLVSAYTLWELGADSCKHFIDQNSTEKKVSR